jgi:hypothetical protein
MNKQERSGISFGFSLVLIWLILLTGFIMYDKIIEDRGVVKTIFLPPPPQLEVIEVEGGLL